MGRLQSRIAGVKAVCAFLVPGPSRNPTFPELDVTVRRGSISRRRFSCTSSQLYAADVAAEDDLMSCSIFSETGRLGGLDMAGCTSVVDYVGHVVSNITFQPSCC